MRVTVLGAGIIGLTVAEELLRRGHRVTVVDPEPGGGASYAAAGMLSPAAEVWHGEESLLRLGLASLERWPAFAARLGVRLRSTGTVLVGADAGDARQVERQVDLLARNGRRVRLLDRDEVRQREPTLGRVQAAAFLEGEASADPRTTVRALLDRVPVHPVHPGGDADVTVLATGSSLPAPYGGLVRGVRGEILRLHTDDPPSGTVRGWAKGTPIYLVPRDDGGVVVGATSEEHDGPASVTAGGVLRLLTAASVLWPALHGAELLETVARDRPATPDGLPLVGPTGTDDRVVLAAGHYRHGVLLAPLTAQLVADHLERGHVDPALDPRRFTNRRSPR